MIDITKYRVEMDACRHPFLVAEKIIKYDIARIDGPERAVNLVNDMFRTNHLAEEMVCLISMDIKCKVLGVFCVSYGTVNISICNPREIFIRALISGASKIIIIHNHPSGDSSPSDSDIISFKKIREASELIGIELLDFIIIGDDYYSFKIKNIFCDNTTCTL